MDIPPTEVSTRGTVPAAVTAPAGSTRPVTAPLVEAVVIAVRAQLAAGFLLDLDIGGTRVEAASAHALPTGSRLHLRETAPGSYRVEELFSSPEALRRERVAEALRGELRRQVLPREVVTGLLRQAGAPGLGAPVRRAIEALLRRLPTPAEVQQPAGLREAVHNSGSFLEARLLRALQQATPGAPATGAWGALRRLFGTLAGTATGTGARAPLPQPIAPTSPASRPGATPAEPAAQTIPLPGTTVHSSAKLSVPGVSTAPTGSHSGLPSSTAGTARTPSGTGPPSAAGIATGPTSMTGIPVPPSTGDANGTMLSRTGLTPAPAGPGGIPVPSPAQTPLPGSGAPATPVYGALPSGATGPMPATAAPTQPGSAVALPGPLPPSPGDSARAPAATPAGALLATSLPQGPTAQLQPAVSQGVPHSSGAPASVPAPDAPRPLASPAPSQAPVPAADDRRAPDSLAPAPPPELPASVLASDLKAQWQLLRAALASAVSRAPAAPREFTAGVAVAAASETAPSAAPTLYTARGLLAAGAPAPSGVARVTGEATPAPEPGTVERLLGQVEGVLARTRVHQFAALPESRPAAEAPQVPAWVAEIPLLHPRGVDVLQIRIEEQRGHGHEGAGERHWQVMLSLDADAIGTLHALVQLAGRRLQATLWAEQEATLRAARAALGELDTALRAQGVEVARLDCVPGRPPHQAMPVRDRLLDVRT